MTDGAGGRHVLTGDQVTVNNNLGVPEADVLESTAELLDPVLKEERNSVDSVNVDFFSVGETSGLAASENRLAVGVSDLDQSSRPVADSRCDFSGAEEVGSKLSVDIVEREIKHGAMPARVEDCVIIGGFNLSELLCTGELGLDRLILQELYRLIICERLHTVLINGWIGALRGDKVDLSVR